MDQDMKSNNLDVHLGHKEFTSGPFQAIKRGTIQLVKICYHTKSAIAQSIVNVRVKAMFVRGSSTHQAIARTQFALKGTGQCMDEVKPCDP